MPKKELKSNLTISMVRDPIKPENVFLETNSYFQCLHGTWQCGLGNQFLFSVPAWNLTMWSWKPIPIYRASMEPDNVVLETYSCLLGQHRTWQPGNQFIFSGPAWNLTMWFLKYTHICKARMEPDNVFPKAYSYFQGQHGTWGCGPRNLFLERNTKYTIPRYPTYTGNMWMEGIVNLHKKFKWLYGWGNYMDYTMWFSKATTSTYMQIFSLWNCSNTMSSKTLTFKKGFLSFKQLTHIVPLLHLVYSKK